MRILFLLLFLFSSAWASVQEDVVQDKKIKIVVPKGWETVEDLYGLPLVILGPWANKSRPAISWMYTGMTSKIMKTEEFKKIFSHFKKEKEDWPKGHIGKLITDINKIVGSLQCP